MKKIILSLMLILMLSLPLTFALSAPYTLNGKTYYKVTSTDSTEDSGDEVCSKAGMVCVGYSDSTSSACKNYNPSAAEVSGLSGDVSGVFCNGAPQNGLCAGLTNTCATCPTCSKGVSCSDPIGGLYNEMYVECAAPKSGASCSISFTASDTDNLINQVGGLNAQLQACPQALPKGTGMAMSDGETQIDINRNTGLVSYITIVKKNGQLVGVKAGPSSTCKQKITISENDLNTALQSTSVGNAMAYLFGQKKAKLGGCSFLSSTRLFFVGPIASFFAKRQAPTPPSPKPAPNCGAVGEQCNNRGCFSGICGAQKTQNSWGQWGYWNYECLDQRQYDSHCRGKGNSPPAYSCLTGICR